MQINVYSIPNTHYLYSVSVGFECNALDSRKYADSNQPKTFGEDVPGCLSQAG